ncbi:MAG: sugar phosphate isomerase/epimerase family protein [Nitrospinota bacterium]|nr:sugar phosphate isomerase/epimerase family protein [Nitrospinota bacterium]
MKISFQVATPEVDTPLLPSAQGALGGNLRVLSDLGYEGVDLSLRKPRDLDLDAIRKEVEKNSLEVSSINTAAIGFQDSVWLCHPDEAIRKEGMDRLKGSLDVAAFFGVGATVGTFRGRLSEGEEHERSLGWMRDAIMEGSDYAAEKGARILFEPQHRHRYGNNFIYNAQEGVAFVEEINSPGLGLMLDTFHMNIEDVSFSRSIVDAKDHLGHMHISDSNRLYPGAGHVPFREIIDTLRAIDYEEFLAIQVRMPPDFQTSAALGIANLRSLL